MNQSIIDKLNRILSEPIDSEYKVVYVLAESRKLLDTQPPKSVPFSLRLYCNWALHVDLDHETTTLPFLRRVERYVESVLAGCIDVGEEHRMLREFVFLDTFRETFSHFLEAYGLPTRICEDDERWHEFLKYYAGVIEDGSLSCRASDQSLKCVKEVIFTKGRIVSGHYLPFGLSWTIVLRDGKKLTVETRASAPQGNEMLSWVVTLH